jgi:hypothetical protein
MRTWNPTAKNCSQCRELKSIKIQKTQPQQYDKEKKYCEKFSWEIPNAVASKIAACKIELSRKRGSR